MSISNSRDEPTKLAEIVVPLLGPSEAQEVLLENGGMARLLHGALSQDDCASYLLDGQICLVAGSDYVRGTGFILFEMGLLDLRHRLVFSGGKSERYRRNGRPALRVAVRRTLSETNG